MGGIFGPINETTRVLLSISLILLAGFLMTRLTKRAKLPNVTGYVLAGVLIGPYVLNLVPLKLINNMSFISDMALAFIAFGVGRFFRKKTIMNTGMGVITIALVESLMAGIFVTLGIRYVFWLDWDFCLLLGAIATATAPASTMVTIRQYRARGIFVDTLLQVVALDDAICLIVFTIALAIVNADKGSKMTVTQILLPVLLNFVALILGFISGTILSKLMTPDRSEDNRLILTIALLLGLAGLCSVFDISPLLSCMLFGAIYINKTRDKELYRQIEAFAPPILSIFYVVSGMNMDVSSFKTFGAIGSVYFLIRIIGKYLGAYLGSTMAGSNLNIRKYLGLALIPQAGVAIGLAFLGKRVLTGETGDMLLAIILASSVLYELIGPVSAKTALVYSGAIRSKPPPGLVSDLIDFDLS